MNRLKSLETTWVDCFSLIYKDGKSKFKNKHFVQKKYLNTRKNQFLKVRNSLLELEKNFYRIERQSIKN